MQTDVQLKYLNTSQRGKEKNATFRFHSYRPDDLLLARPVV